MQVHGDILKEVGNNYKCHADLDDIDSELSFLRNVIYRAQILVNYYILHSSNNLTNDLFEQNFWYTICRLIYGNITMDGVQNKYPGITNITADFSDL
ncbi:hypothetical protein INT48_004387 [Thamnidium elegans]|uniref:Uncharacterized protein n=1 Tax=Thamnidium elegans TaxID=101142 RepID=A0A8H7SQT0_9FUNG|nr:hypothetical protein INT48_004387 [Thamnidium elegans]